MLPSDIPATPARTYGAEGWAGMGDWLGTGNIAPSLRHYRSFHEARIFARHLGLKNGGDWKEFCKGKTPDKGELPVDVPANPQQTYASRGWDGWGDWLGTGAIAKQLLKYRSFQDARKFARDQALKSWGEWRMFCKGNFPDKGPLPSDIPSNPNQTYAGKGWAGTGDWLGTDIIANQYKQYRPFEEARNFAQELNLKNQNEWLTFCKGGLTEKGVLPPDIPAKPSNTYADDGWVSWGDWLGTGTIANQLRQYRLFTDARHFARKLALQSKDEWKEFCRGKANEKGSLPADIPANPQQTYAAKGWIGWGDWLGTGRTYVSKSAKRKS